MLGFHVLELSCLVKGPASSSSGSSHLGSTPAGPRARNRTVPRPPFKIVSAGCVVFCLPPSTHPAPAEMSVLLGCRDGEWMLPRGKARTGESPRAAAVREVFEETGIRAEIVLDIGAYSYPVRRKKYKIVHLYAARPIGGNLSPDTSEFSEVSWFPASQALSLLSPREAFFVQTTLDMAAAGLL